MPSSGATPAKVACRRSVPLHGSRTEIASPSGGQTRADTNVVAASSVSPIRILSGHTPCCRSALEVAGPHADSRRPATNSSGHIRRAASTSTACTFRSRQTWPALAGGPGWRALVPGYPSKRACAEPHQQAATTLTARSEGAPAASKVRTVSDVPPSAVADAEPATPSRPATAVHPAVDPPNDTV